MKIINEINVEKLKKCSYCKSIFSYTMKDADNIFYKLECPVCNHYLYPSIFDKKVCTIKTTKNHIFEIKQVYDSLNEIQILLKCPYSKKKIRRKVLKVMKLIQEEIK